MLRESRAEVAYPRPSRYDQACPVTPSTGLRVSKVRLERNRPTTVIPSGARNLEPTGRSFASLRMTFLLSDGFFARDDFLARDGFLAMDDFLARVGFLARADRPERGCSGRSVPETQSWRSSAFSPASRFRDCPVSARRPGCGNLGRSTCLAQRGKPFP